MLLHKLDISVFLTSSAGTTLLLRQKLENSQGIKGSATTVELITLYPLIFKWNCIGLVFLTFLWFTTEKLS